jgi:hypothetical protein
MFECKGCAAKDQEIDHLRANIEKLLEQLEKAQARVMELAEPGVNRRMNPPAEVHKRPAQHWRVPPELPGYEPRLEAVLEVDDTP